MSEFSGHLLLRATARPDGRSVLAEQSFRAPFHLSKPYWSPEAQTLLVQIVNPTAGILAGDRLEARVAVERGAAVLLTTPSASRVFKMRSGAAVSTQHFSVAAGGWLEVLPEPLVPHRGSRFRQVTTLAVEPGGALFYVDQLHPGRVGHGEAWVWDRLCLELVITVGPATVLRERFDQTGAGMLALAELGRSGPAACFANAVLIAPEADNQPPLWRTDLEALHRDGLQIGVSALRTGGWSLKLIGQDSVRLRAGLQATRAVLARHYQRLSFDPRKL